METKIKETLDAMANDAQDGEILKDILGHVVRCYFNRGNRLVFYVDGFPLERKFIPGFIAANRLDATI